MTIIVKRYGDPREALYVAQRLVDAALTLGGATLLYTGQRLHWDSPTSGYVVGGVRPALKLRHIGRHSIAAVAAWVGEHMSFVEHGGEQYGFGVWTDDEGVTWFDVVRLYTHAGEAVEAGRMLGEKAVWDVEMGEDLTLETA